MKLPQETIAAIQNAAEAVFQKIGAENIPRKVARTLKFVQSQPPEEIVLNGKAEMGIAVDLATVLFMPEGNYRQFVDENNRIRTAESVKAVSVVVIGNTVSLCKSTYDVILGAPGEADRFINIKFQTTDVDRLTEDYIC